DLEKPKQSGEESVVNKTSEETKLRKNATNELSPNTGEKSQQVLDLNKDKKPELENKADQEKTGNDGDDEDNDNDKQSKNNEPVGQIPKPDLSTKKDKEKENKDKETIDGDEVKPNDGDEVKPNDGDEVKPNDRKDGQDEDEESKKELENQQEESDKEDFRSGVDDKGKTGDNEPKPQDNDGTDNDRDQQIETGNPSINDEDAEYEGTNVGPDGMKIKPTNEDKNRFEIPSSRRRDDDDGWSGSFVTYFLIFTLLVVIGYLVLHNKNKLMAYVVEGRRSGTSRTGSRPSHRGYEKLKNVNDIIPIDDTNPISDKEAIILKT
ncbi:unnamed protein product, partial [Rotaria sp. Silwood2]